jgi:hypothetical protein
MAVDGLAGEQLATWIALNRGYLGSIWFSQAQARARTAEGRASEFPPIATAPFEKLF